MCCLDGAIYKEGKAIMGNCLTLTLDEQIQHLKDKGVRFDLCSERDAKDYLEKHNHFFKIRAYRKNFKKNAFGPNAGRYEGLDFEMLKDLAIIDMNIRYSMIHLLLDVEHYSKVKLINSLSNIKDTVQLVNSYLNADPYREDKLKEMRSSPYAQDLFLSYPIGTMPVWVFLEVSSFGGLLSFYDYCDKKYPALKLKYTCSLLRILRQLRNACAHSSCLINELSKDNARGSIPMRAASLLGQYRISAEQIENRTKNESIRQIVTLLYFHSDISRKNNTLQKNRQKLDTLIDRMLRNMDFYKGNNTITSTFFFLRDVIRCFYT